jgi:hypothetical protein
VRHVDRYMVTYTSYVAITRRVSVHRVCESQACDSGGNLARHKRWFVKGALSRGREATV